VEKNNKTVVFLEQPFYLNTSYYAAGGGFVVVGLGQPKDGGVALNPPRTLSISRFFSSSSEIFLANFLFSSSFFSSFSFILMVFKLTKKSLWFLFTQWRNRDNNL